jgi:hypothetical protein
MEEIKKGDLFVFDNSSIDLWRSYSDIEPHKVGIVIDSITDLDPLNRIIFIVWEDGSKCIEMYGSLKDYYSQI